MSDSPNKSLAHLLFFTLKDPSEAACESLLAACRKYLTDHPGMVHFSAGRRAEHYVRPVNDSEFHVAVVLVFETDQDHQNYQKSERHQQFLAEQLDNCAQVRVFDAWA